MAKKSDTPAKPEEPKKTDGAPHSNVSGQICTALVFFVVGLLFIDLIPLQEPMMCGNYTNATLCPDLVFSQSYFDARAKFRKAAESAGATMSSHVIVDEDGVQYTQDVAYLPSPTETPSDRLLVHLSGTHGVEGFVGSAIQTKLLREWGSTYGNVTRNESRKYPSVLFVHAVNPYGFAHMRRFNEHNVDLNRNCFADQASFQEVLERDPNIAHYDDFRESLTPQAVPSLIDRYLILGKMALQVAQHGMLKLKTALVTGQYHLPEGLYFGGHTEQKSISTVKSIVAGYAKGIQRVVVVDVHSGLGPEGIDTLMVDSEAEGTALRGLVPSEFVVEAPSDGSGPSGGYSLARGTMNLRALFNKPELLIHFTEEFGTVTPLFVARALILENNAYHLARGTYVHQMTKDWLRDAFYPQRISFKTSVLQRGTKLFAQMWDALA